MLFKLFKGNQYLRYEKQQRKKHFFDLRKEQRKYKWLKAINYSAFKFDPIRLLGRTYYFRMAILVLILDLTVLIKIFFNLNYILLTIPLVFYSVKVYINFLRNIYCIARCKIYKATLYNQPRAQCSSGAPGSGKSSNESWKSVELAKMQWLKLQEEYWFCMSLDYSKLNSMQKDHYDEVVQAYTFEIKSKNKMHCLWSNIELKDCNNHDISSHRLTKAHLLQKKRLPYRAVLFVDEIGSTFPAKKGPTDEELEKLSRLARWIRHFFEGFWTFTEQDFSKTFVDVRRVTGINRYFISQQWDLKPRFLLGIYKSILFWAIFPLKMKKYFKPNSKIYNKLEKKSKKRSKRFSKLLKLFKRYLNAIGFRHYRYTALGNEAGIKEDNAKRNKDKSMFLPSCLNCIYDDRAFKNAYDALEFDLVESEFAGGKLSKQEITELFTNTD